MAVALEKWTEQTAMAVRLVIAFEDMGTICAAPVEVRCVSFGCDGGVREEVFGDFGLGGKEEELFVE